MNEMIERVADAMIAKWRMHALPGHSPDLPYWRDMARAAIEAMREPTNAMIVQGADGGGGEHITAWRAMIDAAIKAS